MLGPLNSFEWCILAIALPVAAVALLPVRFAQPAVPWLGVLTVIVGALPAYSSSATIVERGSIGVGIGWLITILFAFIGLAIIVGSTQMRQHMQLRMAPFIPLGAVIAGAIYLSSFYGLLPPYYSRSANESLIDLAFGWAVIATPGVLLIGYGIFLWLRRGLTESMAVRWSIRLLIAFTIVMGLSTIGFLLLVSF